MNLWDLPLTKSAQIQDFTGDLSALYLRRLQDLGFMPGETVICLRQAPLNGPKVYQVGPSLIALEKELAQVVLIEYNQKR